MYRIAALLTLIAFAGCASAPSLAVAHTVPPKFNIVPAKRLAVITGLGKPENQVTEDDFINLLISKLQDFQYEVKDERALARTLDPFDRKDWHKYLDETAGEVIVEVGVPAENCELTYRTRGNSDDDADDIVGYDSECNALLSLYKPHTGERIGLLPVRGYGSARDSDTAWNVAKNRTADQVIGSFTPLPSTDAVPLDQDVPLIREGEAKFAARDYAGALSLWEDGLTTFPHSAPLLYNLGVLCEATGDERAARVYYSRAAALAPQVQLYQKALAQLDQRLADADEAAFNLVVADVRKSADAKERAARMAAAAVSVSGMQYVPIPAGTFTMGCTKYDDDCVVKDEVPSHAVTISRPFYFARTPVTNAQYQQCIDAGACHSSANPAKPLNPVVSVTWNDATAFCAWAGGRLPSEAEWEYAARGGVDGWRFPWGNSAGKGNANANLAVPPEGVDVEATGPVETIANVNYPFQGTSPVGTFAPNGFGLFDMAGNASEWTADWKGPYTNDAVTDPTGPATGTMRVVRGGSWVDTGEGTRISIRYFGDPDASANTIGFRCAVDSLPGER